ncbi:MAG TPA: hypothetical protein VNS19_07660 [Acidimicrobiales bacterium]|nr:hypothetical protein [Acidimicrobiales bacterium]
MNPSAGGDWQLPVQFDDLASAFDVLLAAARAKWGDEIVLSEDNYWHLWADQSLDLSKDPRLDMGSLADDVEELHNMLSREDGEVFLWHDLGHLLGVLNALVAMDLPADRRQAGGE